MRCLLSITAAALALSGCGSTGEEAAAPAERRVTYTCEGGPPLTVTYAGETARIEGFDGQAITLPQKPSGSGFWYGTTIHDLRGKGDEVTYTIGRRVPMICRAVTG